MTLRFSNVYRVKPGDNLGDSAYWNTRFQDIDARINALEGTMPSFDDAKNELISEGLTALNVQVISQLPALQEQINSLTTQAATLQTTVNTSVQSVDDQLQALLVKGQGYVSSLETLGTIDGGSF